MRNYKVETVLVVDSVICDRCRRFDNDPAEIQEYLAIDFIGGYVSVFGDMETYTGDICQRCLKEVLGEYLHKKEDE
jgi:antitoxin CcdA